MDARALVRLAHLRGRVATLARGGRLDVAEPLLQQLVRADLALGLPADGLLRARQAAELAEARGEPRATPLIVLAAALLSADALESAAEAADLAVTAAAEEPERPRLEMLARLVGGAAWRRLGATTTARALLDAARASAARLGAARIAGLALAELASVDLAEDHAAGASVCFEFAARSFERAGAASAAAEAGALAVASRVRAGDLEGGAALAPRVADAARAIGRHDLVAYIDGALADAALAAAPDAAVDACALAAESAELLSDSPLARDLRAQARLRQARTAPDPDDRARHLEAGIELAIALPSARGGRILVEHALALVATEAPRVAELERLARALAEISRGDAELMAIAELVAPAAAPLGSPSPAEAG